MAKAIVGVIGGSGVYHLPGLTDLREEPVATPWGDPSDSLRFGRVGDTGGVPRAPRPRPSLLAFDDQLSRQYRRAEAGRRHRHHRSFRLRIVPPRPLSWHVRDDRSVRGPHLSASSSFFGDGCVAHVSMAHPIAPLLRRRLVAAAEAENVPAATAERTSASKVRSFRRWPSRSASRRAAPTSSA